MKSMFLCLVHLLLTFSNSCIAEGKVVHTLLSCRTPGFAEGHLLRLRGGSDVASQMAEIRARRAREYEALRKNAIKENVVDDTSLSPWAYTSGKVNPSTIGTREKKMEQGDARNYYLDHGVTIFRNRKTGHYIFVDLSKCYVSEYLGHSGAILEILDDTCGWFQFCSMEGAPTRVISSAAGNIYDSNRWYVPTIIEQIKQSPIKSSAVKAEGLQFGYWKAMTVGSKIVLFNSCDGKSQVHLHENGFSYLNCATEEALAFDGTTGKMDRRPLKEGEWFKI